VTTVVPTRATVVLAHRLLTATVREDSGAEAAILHLDELWPDQYAALVGLLLDAANGKVIAPPERRRATHCHDCNLEHVGHSWRGLCKRCYDRHRNAGTLGQFARVGLDATERDGGRAA
jgi:hypothetical protein